MSAKQNATINQAIDLLINNDTGVSTLPKEDGSIGVCQKVCVS